VHILWLSGANANSGLRQQIYAYISCKCETIQAPQHGCMETPRPLAFILVSIPTNIRHYNGIVTDVIADMVPGGYTSYQDIFLLLRA